MGAVSLLLGSTGCGQLLTGTHVTCCCLKDLLFAMKTIFGEAVMNTADPAAKQRLEQLAGQVSASGTNNGGEYAALYQLPVC